MNWFVWYIVFGTLSFIVGALIYHNCKPTICDSCKHLEQKNCGNWKYRCDCTPVIYDHFDKAPTYCKYYERRDSNYSN